MRSDDFFKKRKRGRKTRKYEYRKPQINSFLIVTEGTCTEPFYFRGMEKLIKEKIGGTLDVIECPFIDVRGQGRSTKSLVRRTEQLVKEANILYQNVWVVFDKDDFTDFDQAIKEARSKGYKVAWSNQSFEYWIYLHFDYSDAALHRHVWNEKLNEVFGKKGLGDGKYRKNYKNIYKMLCEGGGVAVAVENAKSRMRKFNAQKHKPSEYNPGTTVHELVEELNRYLEE